MQSTSKDLNQRITKRGIPSLIGLLSAIIIGILSTVFMGNIVKPDTAIVIGLAIQIISLIIEVIINSFEIEGRLTSLIRSCQDTVDFLNLT